MRGLMGKRMLLALPVFLVAASVASAAQIVSTTARGLSSVSNLGGFGLTPAGTQPAGPGDLAPVQLFEITKPGNQSVTIGRMFTSCTCVILESDQRTFGPGERAILRMRNIQATPPGGQSYALYVQITAPVSVTLRYDTFVQSSQFVPAPEGAPPTRGNIVADGIYSVDPALTGGAPVDVIVPKAENYVPDTSEYTLRKRAEEEKKNPPVAAKSDDGESIQRKRRLAAAAKADDGPKAAAAVKKPAVSGQLATAAPEAPKKERPVVPEQVRNAISAGIAQVERDMAVGVRQGGDLAAGGVSARAGAEARLAANLSTDQSVQYQTEARQIGRDILQPGRKVSDKAEDDLWRTPTPRGKVRSTASLSSSGRGAALVVSAPSVPAPVVSRGPIATPPFPVEASAPRLTTGVDLVEEVVGAAPVGGVRGAGRSVVDTVVSAESAIAERAREAAQAAGRSVTGVMR